VGFRGGGAVFIVPDILIAWVALKRGARASVLAAMLTTAGALTGGALVYAWSANDPSGAARTIEAVPAVPDRAVLHAEAELRRVGLVAAIAGAFRGSPYKVWSAAAPHAGIGPGSWLLAAAPIRLPRFLLVAARGSVPKG